MVFKTELLLRLGLVLLASLATAAPSRTCVVKASGTNATDDAPAIRSAFNDCGHGGKVVFESTTYYVNSVLNITGLEDVDIDIQGNLLVRFDFIKTFLITRIMAEIH